MSARLVLAFGNARLPIALALFLGACGDGAIAGDPSQSSRGGLAGGVADGPTILLEPAQGGAARGLRLLDVRWGRAVDIYAQEATAPDRSLVIEGFVAAPDELGDGQEFKLADVLVGAGEALTCLQPRESDAFVRALERLEAGLVPLKSSAAALDTVPRDATLVLRFDDLLDPATVGPQALTLLVDGAPVPAQVEVCRSHGAFVRGELRSSRLLLHLAPVLATAGGAEVTLQLSLQPSLALANLAGHPLVSPAAAQSLEFAFQAGPTEGGVLDDSDPPYVVGTLPGQMTAVVPAPGSKAFAVDFLFWAAACAFAPQPGDVLSTPGHTAEVLGASAPPPGGATTQMRVRLRSGDPTTFVPAAGELRARWTAAVTTPPECFVTISPTPAQAPANGASTASVVRIAFSEAMDPASVRAFDTFRLAYGKPAQPGALAAHVVGSVAPSASLAEYTFQPLLPLRHASGVPERYFVRLTGGAKGVRDVAGNPLGFELPQTSFLIDRGEPTQDTGSLSLTFAAADEDGDGAPELRGQMLYDLSAATIRGRPVVRFSSVVDPAQPLVGVMAPLTVPLQTPLNPLGAKLMSVWRYIDLGFSLLDDNYHNLDVEGLAWAPFGGAVVADKFTQFRMALAHSRFLPDEATSSQLPSYKDSGLVPTYASDLLSEGEDPLTVVHDKSKGYAIDPLDLFLAPTGTPLMPWPMNRNLPLAQFIYWTWRDTAKLSRGAPLGYGADPQRLGQVLAGLGLIGFYPTDEVPTIGLPLLTEYRCYPDPGASGLNGFQTAIALNSSSKPTFRAYSAGGSGPSGTKIVDPDNEPVATGGINPLTGAPTLPIDNGYYWGQADFVVRISRAHTRWLDSGSASADLAAVIEGQVPAGTQVLLSFRGATSISAASGAPWVDAENLDPYGDGYTKDQLVALHKPIGNAFSVRFFPNAASSRWNTNLSALKGARYLQARISFVADAATQARPVLDGLGVAWKR